MPETFISNPRMLLKLLRNFGHLIMNLKVNFVFNLSDNLCVMIENYLAEYCSDFLEQFHLVCSRTKKPFENLSKPLKKLIILTIDTKYHRKTDYMQFINEKKLPNIQHFCIQNPYHSESQNFETIHFISNPNKLQNFETVQHLTIGTVNWDTNFPFSFGNLKHFTVLGPSVLNDMLYEYIENLTHLETLKIMNFRLTGWKPELFGKLLQLPNILSNVVEMQFDFNDHMSPDHILHMLKQSQKLKKLSFHFMDGDESILRTIISKLSVEWKVHIIDPYENPLIFVLKHICYVFERITE